MIGALTVAAGATVYNELIKPFVKDTAITRIQKAFTPGPHQQLATLTWRLTCKALEEFHWEPDNNALANIVNQVRKADGVITWDAWAQEVLPAVFPNLSVDQQALSLWNRLVADMLNGDLKDKFLANTALRIEEDVSTHSAISSGEHALIQATLDEIKDIVESQSGKAMLGESENASEGATADYNYISRRTAHLSHAYDIAPTELLQREDDLRSLAELCKSDSGYFLFEAEAYSGKSSLLSWFFLHPPVDTWMIGFFIVGQIYLQSDSDAFSLALTEQLELYLDKKQEQKKSLHELLAEVAELAQERNKKLVLVIDALDEDKSKNREKISILSSLPRWDIPNLVIILSSRPEPKVQDSVCLGYGHPIKDCPVYALSQLKLSRDLRARAREELRALYNKNQKSKGIVSLLAIASGALTVSDLAELTDEIPIEISSVFDDSTARTFRSMTSDFTLTTNKDDKAYTLAHNVLQEQAVNEFIGNNSAHYMQTLKEWCGSYQKRNWPTETPDYLLTNYLGLLSENKKWNELIEILVDYNFMLLVAKTRLACADHLTIIRKTISDLLLRTDVDYELIGLLSELQEYFAYHDENMPSEIVTILAKMNRIDDAIFVANNNIHDEAKFSRMLRIAFLLEERGEFEKCRELIENLMNEILRVDFQNIHYKIWDTFSYSASMLVRLGLGKKTIDYFQRALERLKSDTVSYTHYEYLLKMYPKFIEGVAQSGDVSSALEEVEILAKGQNYSRTLCNDALHTIALSQALSCDFSGAIATEEKALAQEVSSPYDSLWDFDILKSIKLLTVVNSISQNENPENPSEYKLRFKTSMDGVASDYDINSLLEYMWSIRRYDSMVTPKRFVEMYLEVTYSLRHRKHLKAAQLTLTYAIDYFAAHAEAIKDENEDDFNTIQKRISDYSESLVADETEDVENRINRFLKNASIQSAQELLEKEFLLGHLEASEVILEFMKKAYNTGKKDSFDFDRIVKAVSLLKGTEGAIEYIHQNKPDIQKRTWKYRSLLFEVVEGRLVAKDNGGAMSVLNINIEDFSHEWFALNATEGYEKKHHPVASKLYTIIRAFIRVKQYALAVRYIELVRDKAWSVKALLLIYLKCIDTDEVLSSSVLEQALIILQENNALVKKGWCSQELVDNAEPSYLDVARVLNKLQQRNDEKMYRAIHLTIADSESLNPLLEMRFEAYDCVSYMLKHDKFFSSKLKEALESTVVEFTSTLCSIVELNINPIKNVLSEFCDAIDWSNHSGFMLQLNGLFSILKDEYESGANGYIWASILTTILENSFSYDVAKGISEEFCVDFLYNLNILGEQDVLSNWDAFFLSVELAGHSLLSNDMQTHLMSSFNRLSENFHYWLHKAFDKASFRSEFEAKINGFNESIPFYLKNIIYLQRVNPDTCWFSCLRQDLSSYLLNDYARHYDICIDAIRFFNLDK